MEGPSNKAERRLYYGCRGKPVAQTRASIALRDGEGASAVHAINTRHRVERGRHVVGRRTEPTARGVRRRNGADRSDSATQFAGHLLADGGPPHLALDQELEIERHADGRRVNHSGRRIFPGIKGSFVQWSMADIPSLTAPSAEKRDVQVTGIASLIIGAAATNNHVVCLTGEALWKISPSSRISSSWRNAAMLR